MRKHTYILSFCVAGVADELLSQFPPVYCCAGSTDPLLDDAVFLCRRLAALDREVSFHLWDGLPHGFASLSKVSPECRHATVHPMQWLIRRFFHGGDASSSADSSLLDEEERSLSSSPSSSLTTESAHTSPLLTSPPSSGRPGSVSPFSGHSGE